VWVGICGCDDLQLLEGAFRPCTVQTQSYSAGLWIANSASQATDVVGSGTTLKDRWHLDIAGMDRPSSFAPRGTKLILAARKLVLESFWELRRGRTWELGDAACFGLGSWASPPGSTQALQSELVPLSTEAIICAIRVDAVAGPILHMPKIQGQSSMLNSMMKHASMRIETRCACAFSSCRQHALAMRATNMRARLGDTCPSYGGADAVQQ
jgi:hypothetical protein